MYDAINKGMELAHGEILAYLNSDDLYLPWSVEMAASALRRRGDLCYGDMAVMAERRVGKRFFIQYYPAFDRKHFTYEGALGQPSVFWTRSVMDRIGGFDTSYELIGDCEYWLRAARSGMTLHHVKDVLAIQVEHGETLRTRRPERLDEEWAMLRAAYAEWAGPPRREWQERLAAGTSWRANQLRFIASAHRSKPTAWPRFLAWLKREGVDVPASGLLWFSLPGRKEAGLPWSTYHRSSERWTHSPPENDDPYFLPILACDRVARSRSTRPPAPPSCETGRRPRYMATSEPNEEPWLAMRSANRSRA